MCGFFSDTVSFVLRGGDEAFVYESFPRAGYGFFILFLYMFVLPSPVVYYYLRDQKAAEAATKIDDDDGLVFSNPLPGGDESPTGSVDDLGGIGLDGGDTKDASNAPAVPRAALAKLQREAKEARKNQGDVVAENAALKKENERILEEMKQLNETATLTDNQMALLAAAGPAAGKSEVEPEPEPEPEVKKNTWDTSDPEQITAMKVLTEEGMVSEKVLDEAKKSLEDHIVEQIAASSRAREQTEKLNQIEQQKLELKQRVRSCHCLLWRKQPSTILRHILLRALLLCCDVSQAVFDQHEVESEKFEIENARRRDALATKQLDLMKQTQVRRCHSTAARPLQPMVCQRLTPNLPAGGLQRPVGDEELAGGQPAEPA